MVEAPSSAAAAPRYELEARLIKLKRDIRWRKRTGRGSFADTVSRERSFSVTTS